MLEKFYAMREADAKQAEYEKWKMPYLYKRFCALFALTILSIIAIPLFLCWLAGLLHGFTVPILIFCIGTAVGYLAVLFSLARFSDHYQSAGIFLLLTLLLLLVGCCFYDSEYLFLALLGVSGFSLVLLWNFCRHICRGHAEVFGKNKKLADRWQSVIYTKYGMIIPGLYVFRILRPANYSADSFRAHLALRLVGVAGIVCVVVGYAMELFYLYRTMQYLKKVCE